MAKVNFTAERVANFQCEPQKSYSIVWDARTPGLGLRAGYGGAKTYIFEARLNGKVFRLTIGDVRTWPLANAQSEATQLRAMIDKGIDPRQQREEQRIKEDAIREEAKRKNITLGDAWAVYLEDRKPRWGARHYEDHLNVAAQPDQTKKIAPGKTVGGPLASLMSRKLSELTPSLLLEWLTDETQKRPTKAAQSYRMIRAFIRWAEGVPAYAGLVSHNAYNASKVREAVAPSRSKEGDCLQREQLKAWFAAVRAIPNFTFSCYLQGLLLTGARREELAALLWSDVDFQWRSLTIRDKVEGTRTIPLTPYFLTLLQGLKRQNELRPDPQQMKLQAKEGKEWTPSIWVFSSKQAAEGHIVAPRKAHVQALAEAKLPHVSLHGLRRSFGTLCEWVEVPSGISAQIMGHKPSALAEKHYRRRPLDLLRKWHDEIEAWILREAGVALEHVVSEIPSANNLLQISEMDQVGYRHVSA